jgi:HAD superfamily hydrolase (TIGR01457 family)
MNRAIWESDGSSWRSKLEGIKCFVLDMDGTFYLGDRLIDGALDFIDKVRASGRKILFLTNNSSRNADYYVDKLKKMGCCVKKEQVFTSGQAAALYLNREKPGARVFLLGNKYLEDEFREYGIELDDHHPDIVVAAFDTSLTYDKLSGACHWIRRGIPFIATHPDFNCPTEDGFIPDCGAILAFIKASTGRDPDIIIGKPHEEIVKGVLERTGLQKSELALVGDRLYTDIKTGAVHGIMSILVLTGETGIDDLDRSTVKPDMVFKSLKELKEFIG